MTLNWTGQIDIFPERYTRFNFKKSILRWVNTHTPHNVNGYPTVFQNEKQHIVDSKVILVLLKIAVNF